MKIFHPLSAAVFFVSMAVPLMLLNNPLYTAVSAVGAVAVLLRTGGANVTFRSIRGFIVLFLIMAVLNPLFVHRGGTPLVFLNGKAVTLEAVLYGLNSSFSVLAVLLWCRGFSLFMTSDRLFCIIGRFSPKISAMLMMTVRFIPDMLSQAGKISTYSRLSGENTDEEVFGGLKRIIMNFSALVTWSIENAVHLSDSMTARGFELGGRTAYSAYRFRTEDTVLIIVSMISCVAAVVCGTDKANVVFYPFVVFPEIADIVPQTVICAAAFMYPVISDLSVELRRRKLTSGRQRS